MIPPTPNKLSFADPSRLSLKKGEGGLFQEIRDVMEDLEGQGGEER